MTILLIIVFAVLVPSLLVGYLAERFNRGRWDYTLLSLLFGWIFVLVYLLIVGHRHEKPSARPLSANADRARRREHAAKRLA